MFRMRRYRWFAVLSLGIMAGFSLGVGLTSYLTNTSSPHLAAQAKFAELKLHASTAMGSETFAMSTGQIDNETEGVFFLDALTGDLNCFVLNSRVGKFSSWFQTNILNDLPAQKGKKPSYIISTGGWSPKGVSGGNARMAMSVVYVADANSGAFAAYGVPWVTGTASAMSKQAAKIQLLDVGKARSVDLRE